MTSPVLHVCFQGDGGRRVNEESSNQSPAQHLSVLLAPQPLEELSHRAELTVTHLRVVAQSCRRPIGREDRIQQTNNQEEETNDVMTEKMTLTIRESRHVTVRRLSSRVTCAVHLCVCGVCQVKAGVGPIGSSDQLQSAADHHRH